MLRLRTYIAITVLLMTMMAPSARGYSVLTHEAIVDLLWTDTIVPLIKEKFPDATPEQLKEAHAYAYGGSIIQDMGYYPFGSKEFSDLVHYVRSGDFVEALLRDAQDINEYAFAIGALSHYAADTEGHPAINRATAIEIPKLEAKLGKQEITYADDPKAHVRVEFGFDVAQVARQRFPSSAYHDFIGFEVAKPLLDRAFQETYGIDLGDVFKSVDLAIGSYRRAVSKVIPSFTRAALATHRAEFVREIPDFNKKKFLYTLSRAQYEQSWGRTYERPGIGARILGFIAKIMPKVGPFKATDFKVPNAKTEDMYFKSVNLTVERFRTELHGLRAGPIELPNRDFDTGRPTKPGEYKLTDNSYAALVRKLADQKFAHVTPPLRTNLLQFFSNPNADYATKRCPKKWDATLKGINELKAMPPQEAQAIADPH